MQSWFSVFTGVYCSVIFSLIGISILETIVVNFMMARGAESRSVETTAAVTGRDGKSRHHLIMIFVNTLQ